MEEPQEGAVLIAELGIIIKKLVQNLVERLLLGNHGAHAIDVAGEPIFHEPQKDGFLALEVLIEGADGELARLSDVFHGGVMKAFFREDLLRGGQDLISVAECFTVAAAQRLHMRLFPRDAYSRRSRGGIERHSRG